MRALWPIQSRSRYHRFRVAHYRQIRVATVLAVRGSNRRRNDGQGSELLSLLTPSRQERATERWQAGADGEQTNDRLRLNENTLKSD